MKHRDYYQFIEQMVGKYHDGIADPLDRLFYNDGGEYSYRLQLWGGFRAVTIEIKFYGSFPPNQTYDSFPELVERIFFERNTNLQHDDNAASILNFPNRTESEDNLLKIKAGKFYKDICILYTRINELVAKNK